MIFKQELSPQNGRYIPILFFHLAYIRTMFVKLHIPFSKMLTQTNIYGSVKITNTESSKYLFVMGIALSSNRK